MALFEILTIAVGLSLDVFAYALCKGAMMPEIRKENMIKLCGIFTIWQMVSLVLGNLITKIPVVNVSLNKAAENWRYISIVIFLGLGIYMISKAGKEKQIEEHKEVSISVRQIVVWAGITSIDGFFAGIGFGFLQVDFLRTVLSVGILTLLSVIVGVYTGYWVGCQAKKKFVALGGCILLFGGIELLIKGIY